MVENVGSNPSTGDYATAPKNRILSVKILFNIAHLALGAEFGTKRRQGRMRAMHL